MARDIASLHEEEERRLEEQKRQEAQRQLDEHRRKVADGLPPPPPLPPPPLQANRGMHSSQSGEDAMQSDEWIREVNRRAKQTADKQEEEEIAEALRAVDEAQRKVCH